jgi:hypothetical protein
MPRKDAYGGSISAQAQQDLVSEGIENFELPKSLVTKIAKSAVRLAHSSLSFLSQRTDCPLKGPRKREATKRGGAFSCERFDRVYQFLGQV